MRRVVVTGMGMVTPLGSGVDHNWSQIIAGKSGIARIEHFDVSDISCLLYTSPSPRDKRQSRMPSSA